MRINEVRARIRAAREQRDIEEGTDPRSIVSDALGLERGTEWRTEAEIAVDDAEAEDDYDLDSAEGIVSAAIGSETTETEPTRPREGSADAIVADALGF